MTNNIVGRKEPEVCLILSKRGIMVFKCINFPKKKAITPNGRRNKKELIREPRRKLGSVTNLHTLAGLSTLNPISFTHKRKHSRKEMQLDAIKNKLSLNSVNPIRVQVIEKYQLSQKNYMQYLEVKNCWKKWLLKHAYQAYLKYKEKQENSTDNNGSSRPRLKKSKLIILKNNKLINKKTHIKNELKFAQEVVNQFRTKNNTAEEARMEQLKRKKTVKGKKILNLLSRKKKSKSFKISNHIEGVKLPAKNIYERIYSCENIKSSLPHLSDGSKSGMKRYKDFTKKHPGKVKDSTLLKPKFSKGTILYLSSKEKKQKTISKTEMYMKKFKEKINSKHYCLTRKYSDFSANKIQATTLKRLNTKSLRRLKSGIFGWNH
ncbi:unnamed protein product [Moneuplotes crassus]|uniref:Uncharacterized protein n=1 Tax=Euplotes crassus TaxID=5936 RepID=A0AAD1X9K9_EUPCR|nr:unnamed protein product [Moneuplotes crassus]